MMLPFYLTIQTDDDFGVPQYSGWGTPPNTLNKVKGMSTVNPGNFSTIDPKIFENKALFKPVADLLSQGFRLKEMTQESFEKLMSRYGEFESDRGSFKEFARTTLVFKPDNAYDLEFASFENNKNDIVRISVRYKNSPVRSFYIMDLDDGKEIKILPTPFTQNYYTITDSEWGDFMKCLEGDMGTAEIRDMKLNQLLGDSPNQHANVARQLGFVVNYT